MMMAQASVELIDFQFRQVQRADIDLVFKDEQGAEALSEIRHLPGVDRVEGVFDVACTFVHGSRTKKGGITGLEPGATLTIPRDQAGRALRVPPVGLAMSRKLASLLRVSTGDELWVEPVRGDRRWRKLRVVEIVDSYIGMSVYADQRYLSRLWGEELAVTGAQLLVQPGSTPRRALFQELKRLPALRAVSARADAIANIMETLVKNQQVFIGLLVLFAGVIFFGSVLNSSLVSLAERSREVATWRVLGYGEWRIGGLFLRESLLLNTVGTCLGLPLGYLLAWGVSVAYDTEMFRIPVVNPGRSWVGTLVLGLIFCLLAQAVVLRAIRRMDWLEALKTKE